MLKAMLMTTATLAARTPAAPLMPQNHGVGPLLIADTKRMPVGNPKPIRKPAGASTRTQKPARTRRSALRFYWGYLLSFTGFDPARALAASANREQTESRQVCAWLPR